jgi:hypothetical protein
MTNEHTLDRLLAHLRAEVAEARRLELEEADPAAVQEHKRLVLRLKQQLAYAVRDLLAPKPRAAGGRHLPST